jgi:AraC family transcriptional regulator
MMRAETQRTYRERMLRVLVHIQRHLDEALCLNDLARVAHFSPHHFHRIFRGMVGETVMEHIRRLRLERAASRLKHSDLSVTRIAFEAGYETHEAFTRAFRAMFDKSPSGFRKLHQPLPLSSSPSGVHFAPEAELSKFTPQERGDRAMEVKVEKIEPLRVAFMRHTGPYQECGETWGRFCAWAGPKGLFGPNTVVMGISYDDPEVTPPDKIRYDCCISVDGTVEPEGEVGVQTVGGSEYAVTIHCGPYEKLAETYAAICGQWAPASGRELSSEPSLEFYLNDPNSTPPEDLQTRVCVSLEPR